MRNLSPITIRTRNNLVDTHRLISQYLEEKDSLLNYDVNEFKHYIGLYQGRRDSTRIENIDGKLFSIIHSKGKKLTPREIFPISKTCYTTAANYGFFYLRLNENKKVDKLEYSNRGRISTMIKIE